MFPTLQLVKLSVNCYFLYKYTYTCYFYYLLFMHLHWCVPLVQYYGINNGGNNLHLYLKLIFNLVGEHLRTLIRSS